MRSSSRLATEKGLEGRFLPRIVLVHPSAGVNWSGGSEIFAIELTRRLSRFFEVELLSGAECCEYSRPAGGIARTRTYEALRHPLVRPFWQRFTRSPEILLEHLTSFLPCALALTRRPPDLIFPNNDYGGLAMAALVRSLTGTPILFTEHSGLLGGGRCLERNLRFRPDRLVVFSEEIARFARGRRSDVPVEVIDNGIDTDRFLPEGPALGDTGLQGRVVLCVGALRKDGHKRHELAMAAVARLEGVSLLLCGDGPDRDYFDRMGERLLGPGRFARVSVPYERMGEVYRSADLFTLPSEHEPFGLVYVEAMACGLPVVATDDPMRRHIVGEAGLLCDVTDTDAYAGAMALALERDWGTRPRTNALRFSWDQLALAYRDAIYQTLRPERPSPQSTSR